MTILAPSPLATKTQKTVMETIMKPLSYARRGARWLMAAGIAVALAPALPASAAQTVQAVTSPDVQPLQLDNPRIINPEPGRVVPFFTKTGGQRSCDYVFYTLTFGLRGNPQGFANPGLEAALKKAKLDFKDQLPHGLSIVNVTVSGDGTDASGGALPSAVISNSAGPNDTATVSDFRISASDLDGSGAPNERVITFRITAKIDHAAFPAPVNVDNQGLIKVTSGPGTGTLIPSQDPGKPDDGNIATGEKTSIRIDLTKCDRQPPPPTDHECFKVERGTVDCVPGGGAFIYHMPVGPEMGGKWVQVSTTSPGITIIPDTQKVPVGGGVLDWKIVGASPGDVIHLIVTGIETYAGPKEGWGLCCTQTIDIIIPRDQRCPPKDKEPDLKVEKHADVTRCTMGGGCVFTIRVTNVGTAPYNGKIVLDEVTLPAGSTLDSGPNPPWVCAPGTTPMTCTYPVTTLNPGAFVDLKLGFKPAGGWQGSVLRNCATYNYGASGKPLFGSQANDRGCASIPICRRGDRNPECQPPVEKKVDLILKKRARTEICTADGVCTFIIDIINNGTSTYNGPLTVIDNYPSGAPTSSTFGPSPPWTCGPNGPGQFRCDNPAISLPAGASTPIFVKAVVPAGYRSDTIENCAEVKAVPGEVDLTGDGLHLGAVLDRVGPVAGRHDRLDEDRRRGARRQRDGGIVAAELAGAVRAACPGRARPEGRGCRRAAWVVVDHRQRPVIGRCAVVDDVDDEGADAIGGADFGAGTLLEDQVDLLLDRRLALRVAVAAAADRDRGTATVIGLAAEQRLAAGAVIVGGAVAQHAALPASGRLEAELEVDKGPRIERGHRIGARHRGGTRRADPGRIGP